MSLNIFSKHSCINKNCKCPNLVKSVGDYLLTAGDIEVAVYKKLGAKTYPNLLCTGK